MISAKWLFEKHRNHLAMAAFYEEELKRLEIEKDEIIEGISTSIARHADDCDSQ